MKEVGKKGVVKTCVKHSTMKEDIGTTHRLKRRKDIVVLGFFRINFSCTLLTIAKYIEETRTDY